MSSMIEKKWTTVAGLDAVCLIIMSGDKQSHRCGYVRVPEYHKWHGADYTNYDDYYSGIVAKIDVHGGVTFAGKLNNLNGWWLGFDCNHQGDGHIDRSLRWVGGERGTVGSLEYVEKHCEGMAAQVKRYGGKNGKEEAPINLNENDNEEEEWLL